MKLTNNNFGKYGIYIGRKSEKIKNRINKPKDVDSTDVKINNKLNYFGKVVSSIRINCMFPELVCRQEAAWWLLSHVDSNNKTKYQQALEAIAKSGKLSEIADERIIHNLYDTYKIEYRADKYWTSSLENI
ncbi:MAG: hypothetical protein E6Q89_06750 [Bacteroidia bacterium]|nr:MAG: hypothetical protein E6Q89_06750 [Bacteroidia bacterium]